MMQLNEYEHTAPVLTSSISSCSKISTSVGTEYLCANAECSCRGVLADMLL